MTKWGLPCQCPLVLGKNCCLQPSSCRVISMCSLKIVSVCLVSSSKTVLQTENSRKLAFNQPFFTMFHHLSIFFHQKPIKNHQKTTKKHQKNIKTHQKSMVFPFFLYRFRLHSSQLRPQQLEASLEVAEARAVAAAPGGFRQGGPPGPGLATPWPGEGGGVVGVAGEGDSLVTM